MTEEADHHESSTDFAIDAPLAPSILAPEGPVCPACHEAGRTAGRVMGDLA